MPPMRYSRNMSINSDSSKGHDEMESSEMDMELSDDDLSGIDGNMANGKYEKDQIESKISFLISNLDFYNINQNMLGHLRYQPHPIGLNRPPPSLPLDNDLMNQQRKSWIHNNAGNSDLPPLDDIDLPDTQQQPPIGIPPPNSNFNPGFRPRNPGNFRGQNHGGKMMRGGMSSNNNGNGNNSPYNINNNFKNRGRGRGGFRGGKNFRGGQW